MNIGLGILDLVLFVVFLGGLPALKDFSKIEVFFYALLLIVLLCSGIALLI